MADDQDMRDYIGAVLAGLRDDQQAIASCGRDLGSREFIPTSFGTIQHIAALAADRSGRPLGDVIEELVEA